MHKLVQDGLTFDDVLLIPLKSNTLLKDISLSTNLTKLIKLNSPIMSASMDTITESRMAIALARQGGIGIIHKHMPIEEQAGEVDKVKRSEFGVIKNPFSLGPNHYVYEADELMSKYHISGVPITEDDKLVGIITNRDLRFKVNNHKKIYEVMTRENLVTAPEGTTLEQAKQLLVEHKIEKLPIVDKNGDLKGLITTKDIAKAIEYPNSAKDKNGCLLVGAAVGITSDMMERVEALVNAKVDVISIEVVHGHCKGVIDAIKSIKSRFPDLQVIAGNVATAEATIDLIQAGADAIKVGVGPGSVSTTGVISGVGFPQITAIYNCAEAAKPFGIPIIADGGIRFSGDVVKAIAAGANVAMMGRLFAGCDESSGKIEIYQGRKFKVYRSTGSISDIENSDNESSLYFKGKVNTLIPEGVEGRVSYKGSVKEVIYELLGGVRAGMGYCGASAINDLKENARFVKITSAGLHESRPHNIHITKHSSNYSTGFNL